MQGWCSMEPSCTNALHTAARVQGKRDSLRRLRRRSECDLPQAHLLLEQYPCPRTAIGTRVWASSFLIGRKASKRQSAASVRSICQLVATPSTEEVHRQAQ